MRPIRSPSLTVSEMFANKGRAPKVLVMDWQLISGEDIRTEWGRLAPLYRVRLTALSHETGILCYPAWSAFKALI